MSTITAIADVTRLRRPARLWLLCAIMMCALWANSGLAQVEANDAADYQQKLEELQKNIEQLKKDLNAVKSERGKLQEALEDSESEIETLENKVDSLNEDIETQDSELQSLQQQHKQLNRQRQAHKQLIAAQVRSAYQSGPQSPLKILLNQQSPERLTRLNTYHDYILGARNAKLAQYLSTLNEIAALTPKVRASRERLSERKSQLSLRQQQLKKEQQTRSRTLEQLAKVIASKDAQLALEKDNQARLNVLLEEMTATLANTNTGGRFSQLQGQLPWPAEGRLRHRYGSSRVGAQLNWEGIMIEASAGAPVVAVHAGTVIFADYLRGHGLLIIVDHGEGYMSLYAHNQTLLKRTGDQVAGGDIIARVGNSGGQSYSGLYFEIRHQGRPTNPGPWLARA